MKLEFQVWIRVRFRLYRAAKKCVKLCGATHYACSCNFLSDNYGACTLLEDVNFSQARATQLRFGARLSVPDWWLFQNTGRLYNGCLSLHRMQGLGFQFCAVDEKSFVVFGLMMVAAHESSLLFDSINIRSYVSDFSCIQDLKSKIVGRKRFICLVWNDQDSSRVGGNLLTASINEVELFRSELYPKDWKTARRLAVLTGGCALSLSRWALTTVCSLPNTLLRNGQNLQPLFLLYRSQCFQVCHFYIVRKRRRIHRTSKLSEPLFPVKRDLSSSKVSTRVEGPYARPYTD